jgi:hypothetical protein
MVWQEVFQQILEHISQSHIVAAPRPSQSSDSSQLGYFGSPWILLSARGSQPGNRRSFRSAGLMADTFTLSSIELKALPNPRDRDSRPLLVFGEFLPHLFFIVL